MSPELLNKRAKIERLTEGADEGGTPTQPFTLVVASEPVAVQPASAKVKEEFARDDTIVTHAVYMEHGYGLKEGDRLTVDGIIHLVQDERDSGGRGLVFCIYTQTK